MNAKQILTGLRSRVPARERAAIDHAETLAKRADELQAQERAERRAKAKADGRLVLTHTWHGVLILQYRTGVFQRREYSEQMLTWLEELISAAEVTDA